MEREDKIAAYQADITYGTNNEFGFDYLRDNLVYHNTERVQRPLHYAIVDEVDSILIDEARTPLIISGPADDNTELYHKLNSVPAMLTAQTVEPTSDNPDPEGDFWVDEKNKQIHLSEAGHEKVEQILAQMGLLQEGSNLYDTQNITLVHFLFAALRAHKLYTKDKEYVVQNDEVVIVDEFTGRLMAGRRWSDGLHQAVEAKEGVTVQSGIGDDGLDHLPKLLPHVRKTRRHDRHGGHRSLRIPANLRSGNRGHSDQSPDRSR